MNKFLSRPPPDLTRSAPQAAPVAATPAAPAQAAAAPVAPARGANPPLAESEEGSVGSDEEIEIEVDEVEPVGPADDGEPAARRRRVTRKYTTAIFFEPIPNTEFDYYCKVGCLSLDSVSRKVLAIHNSGHFESHLKSSHPLLLNQFKACKANNGNFNTLLANIDQLAASTAKKVENNQKSRLNWHVVVAKGLAGPAKSNLLLLMWQIANGIGRLPANCPIFDLYLRSLGNNPAANRHTLQDDYLPLISELVAHKTTADFSSALSVSLSSDGWRSRTRQDFVNVSGATMLTRKDKTWEILAAEFDIIHVSGSCTADTLESLIKSSVEEIVRTIAFSALLL